jgi:protein gp37
MSKKSKIPYVDDSHAFWRGCTKKSAGCDNCWAEKMVRTRLEGEWGPGGVRVRSKSFNAPLRWNKKPWVCDQTGEASSEKVARQVSEVAAAEWQDDFRVREFPELP